MTTGRYREEVLNVLLALLLHERGVVSAPEQSFKQAAQQRRRVPDVLVVFQGLRTVIEGKVDDRPNAAEEALDQAQDRVDKGVAHIGVAVIYPRSLRQAGPVQEVQAALAASTFSIAVCSEAGQTGWTQGNLDYLAELLRHTFDQLVQEDVVTRAVQTLNEGISGFTQAVFTTEATAQHAAQILGIGVPPRRTSSRRPVEDEEEEDEE